MAEVVGHWTNLAEAQKLTQTILLSGVVETIIERGHMLPMMGVKQVRGKSLTYNRENSWTASDGAGFYNIHQQIPWTADIDYADQVEVALQRIARADAIDRFMAATYTDHNDYEAVVVQELIKRVIRFVEDKLRYGDKDYVTGEFDGIHALNQDVEATPTAAGVAAEGKVNVDNESGALALLTLRRLLDACKVDQMGRDNVAIVVPREIARRFDAGYQEAAFFRSNITHSLAQIQMGAKEIGGRIALFDGIPIIRDDFLVAEQEDTGTGASSNARAKYSTGNRMYSVFVVRFGSVEDGGLEMLFGDSEAQNGEFRPFRHEIFDKLENFDAGGHRLIGYLSPALGAAHSLGRIFDVADTELIP